MTQEEKELLLLDISGRLQSGLKVCYINLSDEMPKVWDLIGMPAPHLADILVKESHRFAAVNIEENIRPYLRPLSSMTEEEKKELSKKYVWNIWTGQIQIRYHSQGCWDDETECPTEEYIILFDWLNAHYFDYRGLIEKGLALKAPEGMYNTKTE